ncbi:MAG: barstar family protein [Blastocatellia bacterium]
MVPDSKVFTARYLRVGGTSVPGGTTKKTFVTLKMTVSKNLEALLKYSPPWLHLVATSPSAITDAGWSLSGDPKNPIVVRFLRGKKMQWTESLFDEFAAALQFPYYFGGNWGAFNECINDLSWLPGDAYVLVITDSHQLLSQEVDDQLPILIRVLQEAGSEWVRESEMSRALGRGPASFHAVFQCPEPELESLRSRLIVAGAECDQIAA